MFFSVSLSAAEDTDHALTATQRCIDEFCAQTGWTPALSERIAGCLQYREYDVFTRQMMRRMGHPTDASHDCDETDVLLIDDVQFLQRKALHRLGRRRPLRSRGCGARRRRRHGVTSGVSAP